MASPPRERPRLNLKPRDEAAAKAAAERSASSKASPFGAAKPRESVLATRLGTDERSVLADDLKKERLNLRLKQDQIEQREQAEAGIQELKTSIQQEEDPDKQATLKEELTSREQKLEELLDGFQKLAMEQAKSGEGVRPSDRRRQLEQRMMQQQQGGGGMHGGHGSGEYGSPAGAQGGYFPQQYGGRGHRGPPGGGGGGWGSASGGRGHQGGGFSDANFYDQPSSFGGGGGGYNDHGGNRRHNSGGPPRDQGGRGGYSGNDRGGYGGGGYDYGGNASGGGNGYGGDYGGYHGNDRGGYQQNNDRSYQPQDRY